MERKRLWPFHTHMWYHTNIVVCGMKNMLIFVQSPWRFLWFTWANAMNIRIDYVDFGFFVVFCSPLPVSCTMNCSHSWRFTLFFFSFRVKSSLFVLHRYHKKRGKKFDKSKTYQKTGRNHHLIVEAVVCHYNSYSRFWHIHAPMLSCSVTAT